jgi:hypothetical protein
MVGEVELSFIDYSASKKVHLRLDIVEYPKGGPQPMYNQIISKQTLHDMGAVLDFKERTITIDEIRLPMRNINNLQHKSSIFRALKFNSNFAQEPEITPNATKCVVEILGPSKHCKEQLRAPEHTTLEFATCIAPQIRRAFSWHATGLEVTACLL